MQARGGSSPVQATIKKRLRNWGAAQALKVGYPLHTIEGALSLYQKLQAPEFTSRASAERASAEMAPK
jgi:hypothetical protein